MIPALALVLVAAPVFEPLQPGVEWATVDSMTVVRVDTAKAPLVLGLASRDEGGNRTTAKWADALGLVVAINAGMYDKDLKSNVGHLHAGPHVNRKAWNDYQSALVIKGGRGKIVDLDAPGGRTEAEAGDAAIQNLRLIKGPGTNVWKPNGRKWSEAALAMDKSGRLLFIFCKQAMTMSDFNDALLALPLEITHAMHLDGGPPASFSLHAPKVTLDLAGNFESGFFERGTNLAQWDLPNVLGVAAPAKPKK